MNAHEGSKHLQMGNNENHMGALLLLLSSMFVNGQHLNVNMGRGDSTRPGSFGMSGCHFPAELAEACFRDLRTDGKPKHSFNIFPAGTCVPHDFCLVLQCVMVWPRKRQKNLTRLGSELSVSTGTLTFSASPVLRHAWNEIICFQFLYKIAADT
jgi:hypothetical protein